MSMAIGFVETRGLVGLIEASESTEASSRGGIRRRHQLNSLGQLADAKVPPSKASGR